MFVRTFLRSALAVGMAGLYLWTAPAAHADSACKLRQVASLPFAYTRSGIAIIPVKTGPHAEQVLRMLFDTGARNSFIEGKLLLTANFDPRTGARQQIAGGGGTLSVFRVRIPLTIDESPLGYQELLATDPAAPVYLGAFDGIIGGAILDAFDEEFDPSTMRINIFLPNNCRDLLPYWAKEYNTIEFTTSPERGHIEFPIKINGKTLRGMLDTGNSHTLMSWQAASNHFGLTPSSPGVAALSAATRTSDGKSLPTAQYTFDTIELGDLKIHHAALNLLPQYSQNILSDIFGADDWGPQVIIGMDILHQLHFYISRNDQIIYFTVAEPSTPPN